jgi:hypothetical protein
MYEHRGDILSRGKEREVSVWGDLGVEVVSGRLSRARDGGETRRDGSPLTRCLWSGRSHQDAHLPLLSPGKDVATTLIGGHRPPTDRKG